MLGLAAPAPATAALFTKQVTTTPWPALAEFGAAFQRIGHMLVAGGKDGSSDHKGAYFTSGITSWTLKNADIGLGTARTPLVVPLKSGWQSYLVMAADSNQVLFTDDAGSTWTERLPHSSTTGAAGRWDWRRYAHAFSLSDGTVVICFGYNMVNPYFQTDCWRSTDEGQTWAITLAKAATPTWRQRIYSGSATTPSDEMVILGGEGNAGQLLNDVIVGTNDGMSWTQVTASAPWSPRRAPGVAVLDSGLLVMGGGWTAQTAGGHLSDVWQSSDVGASWTQVTAAAEWSGRYGSQWLGHFMQVVVIGGTSFAAVERDLWTSDQAFEPQWYQVTDGSVPADSFLACRGPAAAITSDGVMVILGGTLSNGAQHDNVFASTDGGATWASKTTSPGWPAREAANLLTLSDDTLLLVGGHAGETRFNDVWASTNLGATWTQRQADGATSTIPQTIGAAACVLSDDSVVVSGGTTSAGHGKEVWISTPGAGGVGTTWTRQTSNPGWAERQYHQMLAFSDDELIILYGTHYSLHKNAWRSSDRGVTWTQNTFTSGWATPSNRMRHRAVIAPNDVIITTGGLTAGGPVQDVYSSNDRGLTWARLNSAWQSVGVLYGHALLISPQDATVYVLGGESSGSAKENFVWASSYWLQTPWVRATEAAAFSARTIGQQAAIVPSTGTVVVAGGANGGGNLGDVYASADNGATWTLKTSSPAWANARSGGNLVALSDDTLVLFNCLSDSEVYHSTDEGATWTKAAASTPMGARELAGAAALRSDDTIVTTGGAGSSSGSYHGDTHASADGGASWTLQSSTAGWGDRHAHVLVNVGPGGDLVLFGGTVGGAQPSDVWGSSDKGATWTLLSADAGWAGRASPGAAAIGDSLTVVMAGGGGRADVWVSYTGGTGAWKKLVTTAPWAARSQHAVVASPSDGRVIVIGGHDGSNFLNDVWGDAQTVAFSNSGCGANCAVCSSADTSFCTVCASGYANPWATGGLCVTCDAGSHCAACSGGGAGQCTACAGNRTLDAYSGKCEVCMPPGQVIGAACVVLGPNLSLGSQQAASASACTDSLVAVGTVDVDFNGVLTASDVPVPFARVAYGTSPVVVRVGATTQQLQVHLAKAPAPGVHLVDIVVHYASGRSGTLATRVNVTCPKAVAIGNATNALHVTATLQGFAAADFGAADHVLALRTKLAAGLGVDVAGVTLSNAMDTNAGVSLSLRADVPAAALPAAKVVSVSLDASSVAGSSIGVKALSFAHLGRVVSRAAGVCCTATIVAA